MLIVLRTAYIQREMRPPLRTDAGEPKKRGFPRKNANCARGTRREMRPWHMVDKIAIYGV